MVVLVTDGVWGCDLEENLQAYLSHLPLPLSPCLADLRQQGSPTLSTIVLPARQGTFGYTVTDDLKEFPGMLHILLAL